MNRSLAAATARRHCTDRPHVRPNFIRLHAGDRAAILDHLLRLDGEARRMRFMQASADAALAAYVERIDFLDAICLGAFDDDGRLVALVEGLPYRNGMHVCVEAAFSTDAEHRRRGLARSGYDQLKARCQALGIDRIVVHCCARNTAMRRLLQAVEAVAQVEGGEVDATVRLPTSVAHGDAR